MMRSGVDVSIDPDAVLVGGCGFASFLLKMAVYLSVDGYPPGHMMRCSRSTSTLERKHEYHQSSRLLSEQAAC